MGFVLPQEKNSKTEKLNKGEKEKNDQRQKPLVIIVIGNNAKTGT